MSYKPGSFNEALDWTAEVTDEWILTFNAGSETWEAQANAASAAEHSHVAAETTDGIAVFGPQSTHMSRLRSRTSRLKITLTLPSRLWETTNFSSPRRGYGLTRPLQRPGLPLRSIVM